MAWLASVSLLLEVFVADPSRATVPKNLEAKKGNKDQDGGKLGAYSYPHKNLNRLNIWFARV